MRAAFEAALAFATAERRGGPTPIIEHQNVGTILVDMKARLEAARYLTWKACDYFDRTGGAGTETAVLTKINVGVRRPYLQALFATAGYDPLAAADNRPQPS